MGESEQIGFGFRHPVRVADFGIGSYWARWGQIETVASRRLFAVGLGYGENNLTGR